MLKFFSIFIVWHFKQLLILVIWHFGNISKNLLAYYSNSFAPEKKKKKKTAEEVCLNQRTKEKSSNVDTDSLSFVVENGGLAFWVHSALDDRSNTDQFMDRKLV